MAMVPRNVCDCVTAPRISHRDIEPLSQEQAGALLAAAVDDRLYALYVVALTTGMRLGELFGLHWRNVDLKAGTVSVRHTLSEVKGVMSLAEPKTVKGRRLIELPAVAVEALHDHRRRMMAEGLAGVDWVFLQCYGRADVPDAIPSMPLQAAIEACWLA